MSVCVLYVCVKIESDHDVNVVPISSQTGLDKRAAKDEQLRSGVLKKC